MKKNSVLIIDDEIDLCILLSNYFKRKSDKVSYSLNLSDGLEKFKMEKPDLLILDHNLPDGHGIDNIKKFKKENSALCVIVISAMSNIKNRALENGADYFMEKPISFTKLNELIAE